jgi:hypothetical protein
MEGLGSVAEASGVAFGESWRSNLAGDNPRKRLARLARLRWNQALSAVSVSP